MKTFFVDNEQVETIYRFRNTHNLTFYSVTYWDFGQCIHRRSRFFS